MKKKIYIDERVYILAIFVLIFSCGIWYTKYINTTQDVFGRDESENQKELSDNSDIDKDIYIDVDDNNNILININTADAEALQYIDGIGPTLSENIIKYREENGPFKSIEDIKNVPKIGDKTFEQIKNSITV